MAYVIRWIERISDRWENHECRGIAFRTCLHKSKKKNWTIYTHKSRKKTRKEEEPKKMEDERKKKKPSEDESHFILGDDTFASIFRHRPNQLFGIRHAYAYSRTWFDIDLSFFCANLEYLHDSEFGRLWLEKKGNREYKQTGRMARTKKIKF